VKDLAAERAVAMGNCWYPQPWRVNGPGSRLFRRTLNGRRGSGIPPAGEARNSTKPHDAASRSYASAHMAASATTFKQSMDTNQKTFYLKRDRHSDTSFERIFE
jgi:hypothetical protein